MKKRLFALAAAVALLLMGCTSPSPEATAAPTAATGAASDDYASLPLVRVASLKGPTGMGMVELMNRADGQATANRYEFTLAAAADEIVALLTSGSVDVAAIPTNLAASLYQATGASEGGVGKVRLAAINTLGVLYIVERGDAVQSVADLAGKTIHATGQGAVPEYVLDYILYHNGIGDATVEFHGEHAELMALVAAGSVDLALLPEPFVTNLMMQADDVRIALDVNALYKEQSGEELAMGAIVARTDFSEQNKAELDTFLEEYKASVEYVNANVAEAAALIEQYGIMGAAAAAQKAIPNCNIVYIDGEPMKAAALSLFEQLYERNPKAIGGAYPDDYFYYNQ